MCDSMKIPVWMDSWQYQCCGKDFRVGDEVSWTLVWEDDPWLSSILGDSYPDWSLKMDQSAADGTPVARRGGLQVSLLSDAPAAARIVIGIPHEEHHHEAPDGAPATTGRVLRVEEVYVTYRRGERNTWHPVLGTATLRGVQSATRWSEEERSSWGSEEQRTYAGMLIELEVADDDAHDSRG